MNQEQMAEAALRFIAVGYRVLSFRALTLLSMLIGAGLFYWAMSTQTWISLAVAGAYGVLIFLPVLHKDGKQE